MPDRPFNDHSFHQYLDEEKLMGCRCRSCGAQYVPPRSICIACQGSDMDWTQFSGAGRLAAFTVISVAPPKMAVLGYGRDRPYCSGVVELAEGGRVDAFIEGLDLARPEDIRLGLGLKVKYLHRPNDPETKNEPQTLLAFEPKSEDLNAS